MKILCHQGLGDHLLINGLVRYWARQSDPVEIRARQRYVPSVSFQYRDIDTIRIIGFPDQDDYYHVQCAWPAPGEPCLLLGQFDPLWHNRLRTHVWDEIFYHQAGLQSTDPYRFWSLRRDREREFSFFKKFNVKEGQYHLIHEDPTRTFLIDRLFIANDGPIVSLCDLDRPKSPVIFDYLYLLEHARSVHCIPSSFFNLIELIPNHFPPLHLHNYVRESPFSIYRHPWMLYRRRACESSR